MIRRSILQLKTAQFGDQVCIFTLPVELYTVTLSFNDGVHFLEMENECPEDIVIDINNQFLPIIDTIKTLDIKFLDCVYLFTYYNNELKLLSYSKEGVPFSYKITKKLSTLINFPVLQPAWEGTFTNLVSYAFLEDIFIQKSE